MSRGRGAGAALDLDLDDLLAVRHGVARSGATRVGRGPWSGAFLATTRGQGVDVDDLRPYQAGDDPRHVDWKSSARLGAPHTRLYREEKDHAICIALDLRDPMFTGSVRLRAVEAAYAAAREGWRSAALGSRVAFATIDASGVAMSRGARGDRGALAGCALIAARFAARRAALDAGGAHREDTESDGRRARHPPLARPPVLGPSLDTLVDRLLRDGRRLGHVHLVSALDDAPLDLDDRLRATLTRLSLALPLTLETIEDRLERDPPPPGRYRYAGIAGATVARLDRGGSRAVRRRLDARREAIETFCLRGGIALRSGGDPATAT